MRYLALDTETTGLNFRGDVCRDHRIIEIACVEIIDGVITGKEFHSFINPNGVEVSRGAQKVHGITNESLKDKPKFKDVIQPLLDFIDDSPLVIHNAPFDIAFLNKEFNLLSNHTPKRVFKYVDTLAIARDLFPGEDNTLDALCAKYNITGGGKRRVHGALMDARLLAKLFILMY